MTKVNLLLATSLALTLPMGAALAEDLTYQSGDTVFLAYVARPEGAPKGTVLIVHDWNGMNDHEKARADAMAAEGYIGVALDLFGRDAVLTGMDDYRRETGALYGDRDEFRARLTAAAEAAAALGGDMVLTGYCFGGAAVLEAARAGLPMAGFVSFHGGLGTPEGQDYSATTAPVLVLHGSADPVSGMADVAALMDSLQAAGVPHGAQIFGGARHSFTVEASRDWDAQANAGAEAALLTFLSDIF